MNYLEIINEIFKICIIPLFGILTTYFIKYIQFAAKEIQKKTENELVDKYIDLLASIVTGCVNATNQIYVETLKKEGKFDIQAQKTAFEMTKKSVLSILTDEVKNTLSVAVGDFNVYLSQLIESAINKEKKS